MKVLWKDLAVKLEDKPGALSAAMAAIAKAGINIEGISGPGEGGVFHFLTQDSKRARGALENEGFEVRGEKEVAILELEDRPSYIVEVFRRIAEQGLNVDLVYETPNGRVVIGGQDIRRISETISGYATIAGT